MTTTTFLDDPDSDGMVVVRHQDFTGLLDHNAELRATQQHGFADAKHVANIPEIIIESYCIKNNVSWAEFFADQKHIKAILNDPQFAYFRVAPGRV